MDGDNSDSTAEHAGTMDYENLETIAQVSSQGQVTIPETVQDALGIQVPGSVKFARTDEGEVSIRAVHSIKDLRGVTEGKTDPQGRSAVERLREERGRDETETGDDT